jgi:hypothetical protein
MRSGSVTFRAGQHAVFVDVELLNELDALAARIGEGIGVLALLRARTGFSEQKRCADA